MKITKLEAATAQLKDAIHLLFKRRDAIAVHTLAGAASSLLYNLAQHKGMSSPVRGNPVVRDDKRSKWIGMINEAQNFLKHADRDPDETFDFEPGLSEALILEGVVLLRDLTQARQPWAEIFFTWFLVKNPNLFIDNHPNREAIDKARQQGFDVEDYAAISKLLALAENDPSALQC
ncbi:MAG: hypothetical protein GWP08_06590 [Nitrospiraceae bacterium]|nr:hypothetical protein [Nitrospiraceae bacterium]